MALGRTTPTSFVDPSDDCTFWFAGNYLKSSAASSTTGIGFVCAARLQVIG
jgi:hypothetical protein